MVHPYRPITVFRAIDECFASYVLIPVNPTNEGEAVDCCQFLQLLTQLNGAISLLLTAANIAALWTSATAHEAA
jgi:hypothetical protein